MLGLPAVNIIHQKIILYRACPYVKVEDDLTITFRRKFNPLKLKVHVETTRCPLESFFFPWHRANLYFPVSLTVRGAQWEVDGNLSQLKKAEHRRTDAFKLRCCRRLFRVPWIAKRSNQSILMKSILSIHWMDWSWSWNSSTLATWSKELTHWKRPWCWVRLKAGEGDDRRWNGWIASLTQWTWIWANPGAGWRTRKPGVLPSMGWQGVKHNLVTGQQQQHLQQPYIQVRSSVK